jgi:hypothetical protein
MEDARTAVGFVYARSRMEKMTLERIRVRLLCSMQSHDERDTAYVVHVFVPYACSSFQSLSAPRLKQLVRSKTF